jgi:hypothetical protein
VLHQRHALWAKGMTVTAGCCVSLHLTDLRDLVEVTIMRNQTLG